jgi:pyrimidine deaminase RibD-like protein
MSDREIFERLLAIVPTSDDDHGAVAACLVREGEIVEEAVSRHLGTHAEYALLQKLKQKNHNIKSGDAVYVTVEPCGKRTPGGKGEKMGSCTDNLIQAQVKRVVYAAADPDASGLTRHKFAEAGATLEQFKDKEVIGKIVDLFNASCLDPKDFLPKP